MTAVHRNFDRAELWREYDIEATVTDLGSYLGRYADLTAEMKRTLRCHENVAYGSGDAETLDLYPALPGPDLSPAFLFIHGGYWRLGSRNGSGFMAKTLTERGIACASIDYGLAPDVSVDEMVRQARASVAWLYRHGEEYGVDKDRIYIGGSSAGAHLSAMIMAPGWHQGADVPLNLVKGAVLLSGLYDLEPLRFCEPNSWLRLDSDAAHRNSPIHNLPANEIPLLIAYASEETAEFKRQSVSFGAALTDQGFACEAREFSGLNHFNLVGELTKPDSDLTQQVLSLIDGSARA